MSSVVLYGVGSPIIVDFEASLERAGVAVAAAIQNLDGDIYVLDRTKLCTLASLPSRATGLPFLVPLFTPANRQRAAREAADHGFLRP